MYSNRIVRTLMVCNFKSLWITQEEGMLNKPNVGSVAMYCRSMFRWLVSLWIIQNLRRHCLEVEAQVSITQTTVP